MIRKFFYPTWLTFALCYFLFIFTLVFIYSFSKYFRWKLIIDFIMLEKSRSLKKKKIKEKSRSLSYSVASDSLWLHGPYPARLLCPWNSPGKNSRLRSHSLLQGIFPTQGLNQSLLHSRQILYHLNHRGSPLWCFSSTLTTSSPPYSRQT